MKWYPTPSYLLKRKIIIDSLARTSAKTFLEVGCGAGDLLRSLDRLGYSGMGIEISQDAYLSASSLPLSERISVSMTNLNEIEDSFDVVIASEVMEHWEDDVSFLELLRGRVADNGWIILTVPAHMSKWGKNDDFCGHIRRYERAELMDKLKQTGFSSIEILSYGVPIYNIMKPIYDMAIDNRAETSSFNQEKTRRSGGMWLFTELSFIFNLLFNDITMMPFYVLQRLFFATDLGNGYFVIARKSL
jgi:2-polyprenyl-3-methyl-5-hydroxy-6-metoxy-1,4-benzoquinol methylase